jgi:serine/threonine protein kinase
MHRDVKPGNILVSDDDRALISDFGIARTLGDAQLTQSGLVTGTPAYFSPGLARGEDPTTADDVWALGASLYAAVEGRGVFPEQRNALAMLTTIATAEPPEPDRAGFLTHALGRMLDPDPDTRWTMAEAAQALHRLRDKHDTTRTRESAAVTEVPDPAPPADSAPPQPTAAEPAAAQPTAEQPAMPAALLEPDVEPDPEPTREPRRRLLPVVLVAAGLVLVAGVAWLLMDPGADEPTGGPTATRSADRTPSGGTDRSPDKESPSGTPQQSSPSAETSGPTQTPPPVPASTGSRSDFVETYYGVLPDDTESGWSMLSDGYRAATTYDDYRGFWNTISAVTVDDVAPAGPGAVDVTLTYTSDRGTEQEVRRIDLERSGDGYLITGDEAVG